MCLVTFFAVGSSLLGCVSLVTIGAVRYFAVAVMAEAAGKSGMLALVVAQFNDLTGMTGHTGVGHVIAEGNIERRVRVLMAAHTRRQFVMRFPLMALAAERYDFLCCGGMAIVTILASDFRFMFAPGSGNVCRRLAVTFGTIIVQQLRGRRGCRVGGEDHALNSQQGKSGHYRYPYIFHQTAFFHRCYLLTVI